MVIDPPKEKHHAIVFMYYLLLQDRIDEVNSLLENIDEEVR